MCVLLSIILSFKLRFVVVKVNDDMSPKKRRGEVIKNIDLTRG